jgi:hypothetical protein
MERTWIDQVSHGQLTNASQPLEDRSSNELDLLLPEFHEVVDRIPDLMPLGQLIGSPRSAG